MLYFYLFIFLYQVCCFLIILLVIHDNADAEIFSCQLSKWVAQTIVVCGYCSTNPHLFLPQDSPFIVKNIQTNLVKCVVSVHFFSLPGVTLYRGFIHPYVGYASCNEGIHIHCSFKQGGVNSFPPLHLPFFS